MSKDDSNNERPFGLLLSDVLKSVLCVGGEIVRDDDDFGGSYIQQQVSHLKASCESPSETTILVMVDETCERPKVPLGMPSACLSNIVRIYPFNTAR